MNKQELIAEYKQRLEEAKKNANTSKLQRDDFIDYDLVKKSETEVEIYTKFITDLESLDVFDANHVKQKMRDSIAYAIMNPDDSLDTIVKFVDENFNIHFPLTNKHHQQPKINKTVSISGGCKNRKI